MSRTALVTGANRGIGLEFARQWLARGERVIATARSDAGLQALRAMGAQALRLDVADPASISGLAWQLDGEQLDTASHAAQADRGRLVRSPSPASPTNPGRFSGVCVGRHSQPFRGDS